MDTLNSTAEPTSDTPLGGGSPDGQPTPAWPLEDLQADPGRAAHLIGSLLGDQRREQRRAAITLLESLRHSNTTAWLIGVLEQESEIDLCIAAVNLLGAVGDHRCVAALRALKRRFPAATQLQFAVDVALGQIE